MTSEPKSSAFDIILTDAGNPVGRMLRKSFSEMGFKVAICDPVASGVDFHTFHSQDDANFSGQIKSIVKDTGAKILLPVFHPEVIAAHRNEFPTDVIIPVESAEKLKLLDDKVRCCSLASELGILQPRGYASADEVDHYPVVFKRALGHGGDSVYFPKFRKALDNLVKNSSPGSFLITEEIEGEDVTVDALRWGGWFFAGAYRTILPQAKGASVLRESIDASELTAQLKKILESVDYNGVCGADFIVEKATGKAYFLECNPRFGGGLRSQTVSGFDMPALLLAAARGETLPDSINYRPGKLTKSRDGVNDYLKRRRKQGKLCWNDLFLCLFKKVDAVD